MKTVAWRRSGDMRTSFTETLWLARTSSWISPRIRSSLRMCRTCSPTRSRRTERPSGVSFRFIRSQRAGAQLDLIGLEEVARLDVRRAFEGNAAFMAGEHLVDVVLEPPERR